MKNTALALLRALKTLWNRTIGRVLVLTLVGLIRIYQLTLSPRLGQVCRYYPSCSHYGAQAITVHGAFKGTVLTGYRVLRCNPWSDGGIDQVPSVGTWPARSKDKIFETQEVVEISINENRQDSAA